MDLTMIPSLKDVVHHQHRSPHCRTNLWEEVHYLHYSHQQPTLLRQGQIRSLQLSARAVTRPVVTTRQPHARAHPDTSRLFVHDARTSTLTPTSQRHDLTLCTLSVKQWSCAWVPHPIHCLSSHREHPSLSPTRIHHFLRW